MPVDPSENQDGSSLLDRIQSFKFLILDRHSIRHPQSCLIQHPSVGSMENLPRCQ